MSAHSYIYVTIFYFLNYSFFKKNFFFFFLKMMLTYHISHGKIFSTALYVHGRSGVNLWAFMPEINILYLIYLISMIFESHKNACTIGNCHVCRRLKINDQ